MMPYFFHLLDYSFFSQTAIFEAEGIAAPLNRRLNDHTTELLRLKAQYALATNDQVSGF